MLKKILLVLVVLFILFLGAGFLLPRRVHLERTAEIDAPRVAVFAQAESMARFHAWSPWREVEPEAEWRFEGPDRGVGSRLVWDGKKVGRGSQEVTQAKSPEQVTTALDFGKDGKATATLRFETVPSGTKVTWGFDADMGGNPIARYLGLMMGSMLGPSFEKGLASLEAIAEALPKTDFEGLVVETVDNIPVPVACVRATCAKDEQAVAATIGAAFGQVQTFLRMNGLRQAGPPITVNVEWKDRYVFEAGIPVDREIEAPASSPVRIKRTHAGKALKVVHRGPYHEMGALYDRLAAYIAAYGIERAGDPWDEYVNDPGSTPEPELITNVYQPVK